MTTSRQVEGDRRLLQFKTYEDYLDSLTTTSDLCYLQSTEAARSIAELGYRSDTCIIMICCHACIYLA